MAKIATAEAQAPWNCKWIRLGHWSGRVPDGDLFDGLWLCVRPPRMPRYVTEEECAGCRFWEPDDDLIES